MVEIPPKLITKVDATIARLNGMFFAISMHPFVISTMLSRTLATGAGKREKIGDSERMTTKNIAIITPTEIMLSAESITIWLRFVFSFFC